MLPSAEHKAGHIVAAHSLEAPVLGIAVGFLVTATQQAIFLQALYRSKDLSVHDKCVVKAAGAAADVLFHGAFDEQGAERDLQDIKALTGQASFEPYLGTAKDILSRRKKEFRCITNALRSSLQSEVERTLGPLPGGDFGVLPLGQAELAQCLGPLPEKS